SLALPSTKRTPAALRSGKHGLGSHALPLGVRQGSSEAATGGGQCRAGERDVGLPDGEAQAGNRVHGDVARGSRVFGNRVHLNGDTMTKQYDDRNRGVLFRNNKKEKDTDCDYSGNCNIEG